MSRPLPFVLAASDLGPMIVSRLDFAQVPGGFYGVGYQILHTGTFDPHELALIKGVVDDCRSRNGDGVCALDCGANIGAHTLTLGRHMLEWGHVLAFEAQERLFYALAGNIALNNLFNVRASLAAVGSHVGTIQVPQPNYLRSGSLGSLELRHTPRTEFIGQPIDYNPSALTEVPLVSIDSLELPRLDFAKIDVEGMELEILKGAKQTIARCHPTLLIEWIKTGKDPIWDFLAPLGYQVCEAGPNVLATKKT